MIIWSRIHANNLLRKDSEGVLRISSFFNNNII